MPRIRDCCEARCLIITPLLSDHRSADSQSFQFLVAVSEFQNLVLSTPESREGKDDYYEEFISIINEYIKVNSDSEINIDSSERKELLEFHERSAYSSLSLVSTWSVSSDMFFVGWHA